MVVKEVISDMVYNIDIIENISIDIHAYRLNKFVIYKFIMLSTSLNIHDKYLFVSIELVFCFEILLIKTLIISILFLSAIFTHFFR